MIHTGDCLEVMPTLDAESIDAIVTDPPYGLEFMGKAWDRLGDVGKTSKAAIPDRDGSSVYGRTRVSNFGSSNVKCRTCGRWKWGHKTGDAGGGGKGCECAVPDFPNAAGRQGQIMQTWHEAWAREALRVAKPGAYLLAFGGTRTVHRMTCAIEDAGWIIRDQLCWIYASGFPKGRANLKPAWEPILRAQKPFRVVVQSTGEIHHALAALIWLTEGAPDGSGCVSARVASLFDASDPTGTSKSQALASTSLSIASSWASILAAASDDGSRSTTSTATRLTTALRTLRSCLSPVISATTTPLCGCLGDGSSLPALTAESSSSAEHTSMLATLRRSVPESAIGPLAQAVAAVCASIAADLSGDPEAGSTAPEPATTSLAARPDFRPIVMARKPGPLRMLNIDGCRIGTPGRPGNLSDSGRGDGIARLGGGDGASYSARLDAGEIAGRWPANVILTDPIFDGGWDGVVGGGTASDGGIPTDERGLGGIWHEGNGVPAGPQYGDSGTYSRFFLIPKAARSDREPVLGGLETTDLHLNGAFAVICAKCNRQRVNVPGAACQCDKPEWVRKSQKGRANVHPTVKPTDLMRHLVRLVTPPGGTILDPFLGSGTTALAAEMEGFAWVGIEREAEYVAIAEARLNGTQKGMAL